MAWPKFLEKIFDYPTKVNSHCLYSSKIEVVRSNLQIFEFFGKQVPTTYVVYQIHLLSAFVVSN